MAQLLSQNWMQQFQDANGLLVGGTVTFYQAGSTTIKQTIYSDSGATTPLSNPQTLGSLGELANPIYLNGTYNIVIKDSNGISNLPNFDNFDATTASRSVTDWIEEAQDAKAVLGGWATVQPLVTIAVGDVVIGEGDGALYKLTGSPLVDPETDTYDGNGVGSEWINLDTSNAPVKTASITNLQTQITALSDSVNSEGYFYGLGLDNGSVATRYLDIETGTAQDSTGVYRMSAGTAFTKILVNAGLTGGEDWAAGTSQGGFPDNLTMTASTWYPVFMIGKQADASDVDYGIDTSLTATNLLNGTNAGAEGFDIYRQIGYVYINASFQVVEFTRIDNTFFWNVATLDYDQQLGATTAQLVDVQCPPNTLGLINVAVKDDADTVGASSFLLATGTAMVDTTPSATANSIKYIKNTGTFTSTESAQLQLPVDGSSQIRVRGDLSGINVQVWSTGFIYNP